MKKLSILIPILIVLFYIGKYFYLKPKFKSGDKAIDFSAKLMDGSQFNISDLKGKYVLLDFWGSWCGPCRADNPNIVALNETYNGKTFSDASGFEIVSIGVERNEASWKKAIAQDGLVWKYHILQTDNFKSPIPMLYSVREIPTKYLLDTEGNVIFTNPSFAEISNFLNGKLVSK
jgi:thiol-disulfide isomerase/thioredoxin